MSDIRYLLTVDWCNKGDRGIFCKRDGSVFAQDEPHTADEMDRILGPFSIILAPKSEAFAPDDMRDWNTWRPLAEYSNVYGIALRGKGEQ